MCIVIGRKLWWCIDKDIRVWGWIIYKMFKVFCIKEEWMFVVILDYMYINFFKGVCRNVFFKEIGFLMYFVINIFLVIVFSCFLYFFF